jgi:hypothetical protein
MAIHLNMTTQFISLLNAWDPQNMAGLTPRPAHGGLR